MKEYLRKHFKQTALLLLALLGFAVCTPVQAATAPAVPTVTVGKDETFNDTKIKWNFKNKNYRYQIYRSEQSAGGYQKIGSVNAVYGAWDCYFLDESAAAGKAYYYKVRAYVRSGGKNVYGKFSAAKKYTLKKYPTTPVKVTYKGKSMTLYKDLGRHAATSKFTSLAKIWGKPTSVRKGEENSVVYWTEYTYKAGKTEIAVGNNDAYPGGLGGCSIQIADKNGALAGVKVGMSKATAISLLTKIYGKSALTVSSNEILCDTRIYMPMSFKLTSGKVSSMSWFRS